MSMDRRGFFRHSVAAAALGLTERGFAATQSQGKPVTIPLKDRSFCVDVAPLAGANATITDYSGFRYCPAVDSLLMFGGGHAATPEDVVLRFPMATQAWSADYASTPQATMQEKNPDGTYKHLTPEKFWQVPGEKPPIRPISRHTYSGFIWSSAISRMILPMGNNGTYYGFTNETTGGNAAEYDPVKRTWEDSGQRGCGAALAFCEDPVSGNIIAQDQGQFRVYDPRARKWIAEITLNAIPNFGYAASLVHYPPNDRFYYISRNIDPEVHHVRVWEYAFDRKGLRPQYTSMVRSNLGEPMKTNWRPSPKSGGNETAYAYDSENKLIVGSLFDGFMLGFRPNGDGSGEWLQHPAPGTTQQTFYCMDYVPRLNAHFAICTIAGRGKTTFAFRWDPARAEAPKNPNS
jgi:hypothetical protein